MQLPWGGSLLSHAVKILRKRFKPIKKVLPWEFNIKIFQPNKITDLSQMYITRRYVFPDYGAYAKQGKFFK